jgi:hypothetical protein
VLLVTNFGTIIPLDAKTYDFEQKDEHARLLNLGRASGYYTTFWSVFPFFAEDLKKDSILQNNKDWQKLLHKPFELKDRGSNMLVMSERDRRKLRILKHKNNVTLCREEEVRLKAKDQFMEIDTLENLISALKLKRS